jgi:hypothetical protein
MAWFGYDTSDKLQQKIREMVGPQMKNGTVHRLLGFNEPDGKQQANMAVATALDRWPVLESLGVPLVSPSCAHPHKEWMEQFMGNATAACMRVDYIGVHWYGGTNLQAFQDYMINLHNKFGLPLLVTEFSPADWQAQTMAQNRHSPYKVLSFMKEALPWLEKTSWIEGYAWFSFEPTSINGWSSSLFDVDGNLTAIGRYYKSVRSDNIRGDQTIVLDP